MQQYKDKVHQIYIFVSVLFFSPQHVHVQVYSVLCTEYPSKNKPNDLSKVIKLNTNVHVHTCICTFTHVTPMADGCTKNAHYVLLTVNKQQVQCMI